MQNSAGGRLPGEASSQVRSCQGLIGISAWQAHPQHTVLMQVLLRYLG